ncbi:hypothetical protein FOZ60_000134 [Perkinsus olseni]|uniref:Uncharacterized protein n=1 Tax=Perkinsus olseni TaxID=32597 RepID=A0A7J6PNQ2_PEROL|nr:hypothetical protein FOZ60_000134 [Perkinsus olseni]
MSADFSSVAPSNALAWLSSSPLHNTVIRAAILPYSLDDYPEQAPGYFNFRTNTTHCVFTNNLAATERFKLLEFDVTNDAVRTRVLGCPKNGPPPSNTGLDPLTELDQSKFHYERESLYTAVDNVRSAAIRSAARRTVPAYPTLFNLLAERLYKDQTKEKKGIIKKFRKVCSVVGLAIQRELGTFDEVCWEFDTVFKEAADFADRAEWESERVDGGRTMVRPRRGETEV